MNYTWLIVIAVILMISAIFYGNYRINKHFKKKQDLLFQELLKYDHHVFRNIRMKTFGKTPLGNRFRVFISHVAFIDQSIIIVPHKTNSRRELVQSQPILQFTMGGNPNKLVGVSFYQKLDRMRMDDDNLVLEYVRTDQIANINARIDLDFSTKEDQLRLVLDKMK